MSDDDETVSLTDLQAARAVLEKIRSDVEELRSPRFMHEFGVGLLKALFAQAAPPPDTAPSANTPDAPTTGMEPEYYLASRKSESATADTYQRMLAFFPLPSLIVEADGEIVAANVPAEELFGKAPLRGANIDALLPERHRSQHAYWRAGFIRRPAIRLMGRGRSVVGMRGDGVEMDLDVGLAPIPDAPGLTFAFMVARSARG